MFDSVGQILVLVMFVIFVFTTVMYGLTFYVDYRDRKNVNLLRSKVSILKLMLKTKVKSLDQKFQSNLKLIKQDEAKIIKEKISGIRSLEMNQSADFKRLIEILISTLDEIDRMSAKKTPAVVEAQPVDKRLLDWERLLGFDRRLIVLMYELINHIQMANSAISQYNANQKKVARQIASETVIEVQNFDVLMDLMIEVRPLAKGPNVSEALAVETKPDKQVA
jgi:hypothetical protein